AEAGQRQMIAPKTAAIVLAAVSIAATGCGSPTRSSRPDRAALRSVSLPDLGATAEPVRVQLRDRFASLTRTIRDAHAPAVDLAAAYGEMGKLLMAGEYREEAETCFLNAESLAPAQFKWPHYLGHL